MEKLNRIANKSLGGMIKSRINSAERERQAYWDILFSCVMNCYEHADVSWVAKGLEMSKAVGRYRATLSILKTVVPYPCDKGVFGGKRKVGMYDKLKDTVAEVLLVEINRQKEDDSKPKTAKEYEFYASLESFLKKAASHDITDVQVIEAIRDHAKKAA